MGVEQLTVEGCSGIEHHSNTGTSPGGRPVRPEVNFGRRLLGVILSFRQQWLPLLQLRTQIAPVTGESY